MNAILPMPVFSGIELTDSQRAFLESKTKVKGFAGERGTGKTFAGVLNLLQQIKPNGNYLVLIPKFTQFSLVASAIFQHIPYRGLVGSWRNGMRPVFEFTNGAKIHIESAENPDLLRGRCCDGVWIDDAENVPLSVFLDVCGTLDKSGELTLTFTPNTPDPKCTMFYHSVGYWLNDVFCPSLGTSFSAYAGHLSLGASFLVYAGHNSNPFGTQIKPTPTPTPETFSLRVGGRTTKPIPVGASPQEIQAALDELVPDYRILQRTTSGSGSGSGIGMDLANGESQSFVTVIEAKPEEARPLKPVQFYQKRIIPVLTADLFGTVEPPKSSEESEDSEPCDTPLYADNSESE